MGETLMQRTPRGGKKVLRIVKLLLLGKIEMVPNKEVTANYVPAAAVKRRVTSVVRNYWV